MSKVAPYYKAVAGALLAGISALTAGLVDGHLDTVEWLTAIAALIVAGGAVFQIPNVRAAKIEEPPPPPTTTTRRRKP